MEKELMDIDDIGYEGEEIKFAGKVRHIKYAIKGLKFIAKKYGSVVVGFEKMKTMNQDFDEEAMDDIVLLLFAGLIHEDPNLTIEKVESSLTMSNMTPIFNKMINSFIGSNPESESEDAVEVGEQLA